MEEDSIMYIVANRIPIKDEWQNTFEDRFRERAEQIERQPGFLRMLILRPDKDYTPPCRHDNMA